MHKYPLLSRAKKFCETSKYRFTEPRERVLSILASCNEPMGAYQILALLSSGKEKVNPPTVYRAIDFWSEHGFIHKVESMNAYISCCAHKHHENFCIFICDECSTVFELEIKKLSSIIMANIENESLTVTSSKTEIYGKCDQCS